MNVKRWLGRATAACSLVGLLAGGAMAVDARYAKAGDVKGVRTDLSRLELKVEVGQKENRRFSLRQELFMLTNPKLVLSDRERNRLEDLRDELRRIDVEIAEMRRRLQEIPQ